MTYFCCGQAMYEGWDGAYHCSKCGRHTTDEAEYDNWASRNIL